MAAAHLGSLIVQNLGILVRFDQRQNGLQFLNLQCVLDYRIHILPFHNFLTRGSGLYLVSITKPCFISLGNIFSLGFDHRFLQFNWLNC